MAWSEGQTLKDGQYTIVSELGQGSFGITYLAQEKDKQYVVIKTLNNKKRRDPNFDKYEQDFLNEARRLVKCSNSKNPHPNIVQIYELFPEGDTWCMVMEYINGESLAHRITYQGVLSEAEALRYIQQIGNALTVIHNQGLLHRDIKPLNIMLRPIPSTNSYDAVLIDFGIAREFTPSLTQVHTEFVSDGYAPIEQYVRFEKRGACSDVYALAATLYTALTGTVPTSALLRDKGTPLKSPKKFNPSVSLETERAILKGMAFQPHERPESVHKWLELLSHPYKDYVEEQANSNPNSTSINSTASTSKKIPKQKKQAKGWDETTAFVILFSLIIIISSLPFGLLLSIQSKNNFIFLFFSLYLTSLILAFLPVQTAEKIFYCLCGW